MMVSLRERIEMMRQGVIHRYVIPMLEMRGFMVSDWKRPISLEDQILRDDGWKPIYTAYATWETYTRDAAIYLYFNTFYGDVHEKAYKHCFVEYLLRMHNRSLPPSVLGIFTRLNVSDGYYWKHRMPVSLEIPESVVRDIDSKYDELLLLLSREKVIRAKPNAD
ncbi:MAG: hypothetical protein QW815_04650 [Nitrososphaerota archaeon]